MRNEKGQFIKGCNRIDMIGENNPRWNGGSKKCLDCRISLTSRGTKIKRCQKCYFKTRLGKNNNKWKGGKETEKIRAIISQQTREVRKRGNGGSFTLEEWNELLKKFNYMCLCCKRFEPEIKLTVDHILPISMGGRNDIQNLQPLCKSCNCRKHTKHIDYISNFYQFNETIN